MNSKPLHLIEWAREIQALAQTGSHYAHDDFQRDRYRRFMEIASEMMSRGTGVETRPLVQAFSSQIGYATPKIDVRAAVFRGDNLLLVRERVDGGWTMPGGWADVGDSPSAAAEREAWEEAGFHVKAHRVIGVYDANRVAPIEVFHAYKILFLCRILDGECRTSKETVEVAFFSRDRIPTNLSGERTTVRHIGDAFGALSDPACPTVFD